MKFSCICSTLDVVDIAADTSSHNGDEEFRLFSYNELKAATTGFKSSNKIGQGGFGSVFKVADFGLARLFRDDSSYISTRVAGTLGYLSPEYVISGHLTCKSDVNSYAVLLLEIVSGMSVVAFDMERGEQFLVDKAWEMYNADELVQLVDPEIKGDFSEEEAIRFMKIGLLCVQEKSKLRPRMSLVIKMLKNEVKIGHSRISQPGFVADLMDVKVGACHASSTQSFSPL